MDSKSGGAPPTVSGKRYCCKRYRAYDALQQATLFAARYVACKKRLTRSNNKSANSEEGREAFIACWAVSGYASAATIVRSVGRVVLYVVHINDARTMALAPDRMVV